MDLIQMSRELFALRNFYSNGASLHRLAGKLHDFAGCGGEEAMKFGSGKAAEISRMTACKSFPSESHDAAVVQLRIVAEEMFPRLVGQQHAAAKHVPNDGLAHAQHHRRRSPKV